MEARHLLKEIKDGGWYLGEAEGGCRQYVHKEQSHAITVCVRYNDVLGPETQASLERAAEARPVSDPATAVEPTGNGFCAYSPDLPGVVATGDSEDEVRQRLADAIQMHAKFVREHSTEPR